MGSGAKMDFTFSSKLCMNTIKHGCLHSSKNLSAFIIPWKVFTIKAEIIWPWKWFISSCGLKTKKLHDAVQMKFSNRKNAWTTVDISLFSTKPHWPLYDVCIIPAHISTLQICYKVSRCFCDQTIYPLISLGNN